MHAFAYTYTHSHQKLFDTCDFLMPSTGFVYVLDIAFERTHRMTAIYGIHGMRYDISHHCHPISTYDEECHLNKTC